MFSIYIIGVILASIIDAFRAPSKSHTPFQWWIGAVIGNAIIMFFIILVVKLVILAVNWIFS